MDQTATIKALLMQAAYTAACAVCEPLIQNPDGSRVDIDPLIQDLELQQKNLMVYEVAKAHYHAILRGFHDKTGVWPDPKPSVTGPGVTDVIKAAAETAAIVLPKLPGAELVK